MNTLYVGFDTHIDLPKGGYLLIDDEPPSVPRSRIFDVSEHCFNPLKDISYKTARELASVLYTVYPQGDATLSVRDGRIKLRDMLEKASRLDRIEAPMDKTDRGAVDAYNLVKDILASPVLKRVLCNPTNFSFRPNSRIVARLNRSELGDFDALVLGLFLMAHHKGQVVVTDFGFYGRDAHGALVREKRLSAQVNSLDELPSRLRRDLLSIEDKKCSRALYEDAEIFARYEGHVPHTVEWNQFMGKAMGI